MGAKDDSGSASSTPKTTGGTGTSTDDVSSGRAYIVELDEREELFLPSVDVGPISPAKAIRLTGWRPTPMAEWIKETVRWNLTSENRRYAQQFEGSSSSSSSSSSDSS